jgi:exopolysaccharide biosynthesis polyprenyl glycosylphosphotransferase
MNKTLQVIKYVTADLISAALAWGLFFAYRKYSYSPDIDLWDSVLSDKNFLYGIIIIPVAWVLFYVILGNYKRIYHKSRLKEIGQTLGATVIGVTVLFFTLIIDDLVANNYQLFKYLLVLFTLHFGFTSLFRFILTSFTAYKIHNRIIGFNTLVIGGNGRATKMYKEIENEFRSSGNKFVGFVNVKEADYYMLSEHLPHLGNYKDVKDIIAKYGIEEVIIAIDPSEHEYIRSIITILNGSNIIIKIIPDMHDILLGTVKMTAIFQAPLIQIFPDIMPNWQLVVKRLMDIVFSLVALIVLSPVFVFTALGVYFTSKGPIFYSHERIGLNGKPFKMVKFRSMYQNSETDVPMLSSESDPRITPFGRFMRKVRLDEIPQFFTVLKGEMSLVGYRPERQFFIDQIVKEAPHYKLLLKIKPGITSWGQVKFGYAENVEEMIERLKYDILYLENMSIAMDLKILFYTFLIVLLGRGK